ncbi:MAG TPA: PQQ-dependent sugar dehydrogenase [Saprospiraceae bacterium]|nr:PQQ-dependent sugar dehydrogenase [Saprospiraceae bacterium]
MKYLLPIVAVFLAWTACKPGPASDQGAASSADSASIHEPGMALKGLETMDSLEVSLFASEPMLINPTNIDIDHRGRVYVCEAYNYRPQFSGVNTRFEGDRIVILEDVDGDGNADSSKVFYQGSEVNAPLGICVLGNEVLISQSPYIWKFTDTNFDDRADLKEILFQGIQGIQDDHGAHALALGPDGRYYFTLGNAGKTISDKNNKPIMTLSGKTIHPDHFRQGMILRGRLDGTGFEVVGHNFRNNYESAVDAFGNIWQSDNDDDGNRGTRLNYILEYGNYGYRDELTNASWQAYRANIEDSIPLRHWHQNDPGVVPNLLQTGSGSPAGIAVYEGQLIPSLEGTILHAEALHHVIRAYSVSGKGAGKFATIRELMKNSRDTWFRPVDVCVAPDGSVFVADWYDPGVGGNYAGDQARGRIYRIAPKNTGYFRDTFSRGRYPTAPSDLKSPNLSTRSLAQLHWRRQGMVAIKALLPLARDTNPVFRARALWILSAADPAFVDTALADHDENICIAGLRMARSLGPEATSKAIQRLLTTDHSYSVWRECAIALRELPAIQRISAWNQLAQKYLVPDRWYLEALGIGADLNWDPIFTAWLKNNPDPIATEAQRDIVWRSRSSMALPLLKQLATEGGVPLKSRLRYFRALDFNPSPLKNKILMEILEERGDSLITDLVVRALDPSILKQNKKANATFIQYLSGLSGGPYLDLVEKFKPVNQNDRLFAMMGDSLAGNSGGRAARAIIQMSGWKYLEEKIRQSAEPQLYFNLKAIEGIGTRESLALLESFAKNEAQSQRIRKQAYRSLGKSWAGEDYVLSLLARGEIPDDFLEDAISGPGNAWRLPVRNKALEYSKSSAKSLEWSLASLENLSPDPENGQNIFEQLCTACHRIAQKGTSFGPDLDDIGSKYGKEAILTSITEPSRAINFGYEGIQVILLNGSIILGIRQNETAESLTVKTPGGYLQTIEKKTIRESTPVKQSLMTPDLYKHLSAQELTDLLEYLSLQKKTL